MSRRKLTRIVIIFAVLFLCYAAYRGVFGESGVAADVRELAHAYQGAGPAYAACYTNSFFQNMPFVEPVVWKRPGIRPYVSLTSRVDVVAFKRKMAQEHFQSLLEESSQGKGVAFFSIHHRVDEWVIESLGTLNLASGAISMKSWEFETKLDQAEWRHLTNHGVIQFDFNGTN